MDKKINWLTTPQKISKWKNYFYYVRNVAVSLLITLSITWCSPRSSQEIEAELSDVESEMLTRGDNQREGISKDWNIYLDHLWNWDDKIIEEMVEWTRERAQENREKYNELNKERTELLKELDEAKARESKWKGNISNERFDEEEFKISDNAIRESMKNRKSK